MERKIDVIEAVLRHAVNKGVSLATVLDAYAKQKELTNELIEAAKDVDAGSGGCPCPTCERLRKALANVGAQK